MVGRRSVWIGMTAVYVLVSVIAADSVPAVIDGDLRGSRWSTVFTNAVPLTWDWNDAATRVELNIHGMTATWATNFTAGTTHYLWRPFTSEVPMVEDVYTATLTLFTDEIHAAEAFTSRLAVVTGAFGETSVNAVSNSLAWGKVRTDAVVPYDAAFAATNAASAQLVIAKVGGVTRTSSFADAAGYFGWKIKNSGWGYGVFDLALTFSGRSADILTAELTRPLDGTMIKMR